jgi:hypothetical protein
MFVGIDVSRVRLDVLLFFPPTEGRAYKITRNLPDRVGRTQELDVVEAPEDRTLLQTDPELGIDVVEAND